MSTTRGTLYEFTVSGESCRWQLECSAAELPSRRKKEEEMPEESDVPGLWGARERDAGSSHPFLQATRLAVGQAGCP